MFQPQFSLTNQILNNIAAIERLYGKLESLNIPSNLQLNLERDHLIRSTYISNSIEGNPLSLPEVTNIILDDRIPANRNEQEVKSYFQLLKSLPQLINQPISLKLILKIHYQLLHKSDHKIAGKIRNQRIVIGKYLNLNGTQKLHIQHEPPTHSQTQIKTKLNQLINWLNTHNNLSPLIKAGIFHHQYVYIHPFVDGNGRTCRLLTALILLKNHYQINKYFILDDYYDLDRLQYSEKLHTADFGNKTEWLEYFTNGIKISLQSSLANLKSKLQIYQSSSQLTPKEQEILTFIKIKNAPLTSTQIAQKFKISRQQAHRLLSNLVQKGFLTKLGKTKQSRYYLKQTT